MVRNIVMRFRCSIIFNETPERILRVDVNVDRHMTRLYIREIPVPDA